jgi:hypothetical protein
VHAGIGAHSARHDLETASVRESPQEEQYLALSEKELPGQVEKRRRERSAGADGADPFSDGQW